MTQAQPTYNTQKQCNRLMDYVATYPDVYIRYLPSNMILEVNPDAAYLALPKAQSRIAGFFHLTDHKESTKLNGPLLVECKTIKHVISSVAEAETSTLYHNAQTAFPHLSSSHCSGSPSTAHPIKIDNSTAHGYIYKNIHQGRSKSWDMHFYWLRDKETQDQIQVYWRKGTLNHTDYFTKTHTSPHHCAQCNKYLQDINTFNCSYIITQPKS